MHKVQPCSPELTEQVREFVASRWGADYVVAHGEIFRPEQLPGFVVMRNREIRALATYRLDGPACELITLDSLDEGQGIGTALLQAVVNAAQRAGAWRLWLVTTNDNLRAVTFYQKRGFSVVTVHAGVMERSRHLKPAIPEFGCDGIPICDEIEMELTVGN
jgi:ribosomal protein S18 acetylase RimI-like enzyme